MGVIVGVAVGEDEAVGVWVEAGVLVMVVVAVAVESAVGVIVKVTLGVDVGGDSGRRSVGIAREAGARNVPAGNSGAEAARSAVLIKTQVAKVRAIARYHARQHARLRVSGS